MRGLLSRHEQRYTKPCRRYRYKCSYRGNRPSNHCSCLLVAVAAAGCRLGRGSGRLPQAAGGRVAGVCRATSSALPCRRPSARLHVHHIDMPSHGLPGLSCVTAAAASCRRRQGERRRRRRRPPRAALAPAPLAPLFLDIWVAQGTLNASARNASGSHGGATAGATCTPSIGPDPNPGVLACIDSVQHISALCRRLSAVLFATMQCALTTSPATQRVHARRSGRQALRVHATAQTSTGLPKPKWAGGPGAGSGRAGAATAAATAGP